MAKKYIIELTKEEREELLELTRKGKSSARKVKRAHILLLANEGKTDISMWGSSLMSMPANPHWLMPY